MLNRWATPHRENYHRKSIEPGPFFWTIRISVPWASDCKMGWAGGRGAGSDQRRVPAGAQPDAAPVHRPANPYIDPLHIAQLELMRRLRDLGDGEEPVLEQALKFSIAGIAAGLRNTG